MPVSLPFPSCSSPLLSVSCFLTGVCGEEDKRNTPFTVSLLHFLIVPASQMRWPLTHKLYEDCLQRDDACSAGEMIRYFGSEAMIYRM